MIMNKKDSYRFSLMIIKKFSQTIINKKRFSLKCAQIKISKCDKKKLVLNLVKNNFQ